MKRSVVGIIITVVAVAGIAGTVAMSRKDTAKQSLGTAAQNTENTGHNESASQATTSEQSEPVSTGAVTIQDFAFSPQKITIKKGTKVTWINQDDAKHDITPSTKVDFFKPSRLLARGETYELTFDEAGTFNYFCSPHPYMKATVVVTE